jgi:hypothetical protein
VARDHSRRCSHSESDNSARAANAKQDEPSSRDSEYPSRTAEAQRIEISIKECNYETGGLLLEESTSRRLL